MVEGVVWELRFTGTAGGCTVELTGMTGKCDSVVAEASWGPPLLQAIPINSNAETVKKVMYFIFQI
jgi:hypothetical protein